MLVGLGKEVESLGNGDGKTSDIVSHDSFSLLFLRFRSKKAGLTGVPAISTLHVSIATISDIGGLKFAWGWRHKKAT